MPFFKLKSISSASLSIILWKASGLAWYSLLGRALTTNRVMKVWPAKFTCNLFDSRSLFNRFRSKPCPKTDCREVIMSPPRFKVRPSSPCRKRPIVVAGTKSSEVNKEKPGFRILKSFQNCCHVCPTRFLSSKHSPDIIYNRPWLMMYWNQCNGLIHGNVFPPASTAVMGIERVVPCFLTTRCTSLSVFVSPTLAQALIPELCDATGPNSDCTALAVSTCEAHEALASRRKNTHAHGTPRV